MASRSRFTRTRCLVMAVHSASVDYHGIGLARWDLIAAIRGRGGEGVRQWVTLRNAVNPSMGGTHAFDGWPWTATPGLSGTRIEERNAPGETFCAFAIPHPAESG